MGIVDELIDEHQELANARMPWEKYWREVAMYVLPQTEGFDRIFSTNRDLAIKSVVSTPVAAEKSKHLYDMTSLWGIERLTAGMISLKTPESDKYQSLTTDSYFGEEPTHDEKLALERLENYLFKVRGNPNTGFWSAHRAAVKSMCGFGDGWMFIEELPGGTAKTPYQYTYMPLVELYPAVSAAGRPNRMFRLFSWSAVQAVGYFGKENCPAKIVTMANDPKQRHDRVLILHCVRPRNDTDRVVPGVRGGAFQSFYVFPDEKALIGRESGYYEFPFTRYSWSNSGNKPFSEGPIAYALGEVKSLQEMAKNELLAIQTSLRPAYGTAGKNFVKLNFNPGAMNPNMVNGNGQPLFAPLNTGVRPDFAQTVIEARRNSAREMLYLNLWQILLNENGDETATQALIRAQEKGEMLGPVGISMNEGLSALTDREIAILGRKRAFDSGSPLEMPDSMVDKDVSPTFTSPLDRLRRMGEMVGMQRLVEFIGMIEAVKPGAAARLDVDEMIDVAQEILGAPIRILGPKEDAKASRDNMDNMQNMMGMLAMLKGGGEAAKAVGEGGTAMAQGAESADAAPALKRVMRNAPAVAGASMANMSASGY